MKPRIITTGYFLNIYAHKEWTIACLQNMTNSYTSKYSYVFPHVTCSVPWASEQGAVLTAYKSELSGQTNMALHFGNMSRTKKPCEFTFQTDCQVPIDVCSQMV